MTRFRWSLVTLFRGRFSINIGRAELKWSLLTDGCYEEVVVNTDLTVLVFCVHIFDKL